MVKTALTAAVLFGTIFVGYAHAEKDPDPHPCIPFFCGPGPIIVLPKTGPQPSPQPSSPAKPVLQLRR